MKRYGCIAYAVYRFGERALGYAPSWRGVSRDEAFTRALAYGNASRVVETIDGMTTARSWVVDNGRVVRFGDTRRAR